MKSLPVYVAAFAALAMVQCRPAAKNVAQEPELEQLIQDLIVDDAKAARAAQEQLRKMGREVVPVLFDRLVTSGWDLKPPLLEVLSYHGLGAHGLEWAKKKSSRAWATRSNSSRLSTTLSKVVSRVMRSKSKTSGSPARSHVIFE